MYDRLGTVRVRAYEYKMNFIIQYVLNFDQAEVWRFGTNEGIMQPTVYFHRTSTTTVLYNCRRLRSYRLLVQRSTTSRVSFTGYHTTYSQYFSHDDDDGRKFTAARPACRCRSAYFMYWVMKLPYLPAVLVEPIYDMIVVIALFATTCCNRSSMIVSF